VVVPSWFSDATEVSLPQPDPFEIASFRAAIFSLVCDWVEGAGLDPDVYGTQSLRRTKVLLIVQTTGNLKAAQLLLGHTKIESTARYLETELNAALKISEKVEL
jgi:integrase